MGKVKKTENGMKNTAKKIKVSAANSCRDKFRYILHADANYNGGLVLGNFSGSLSKVSLSMAAMV